MYRNPTEIFEWTAEREKRLREAVIDQNGPGTILHDFEALLDYIREQDIELTASFQLPLRILSEINARLVHPLKLGLKRPQQKSFPPIHGLYLLVRASGITRVEESGSKPRLIVDATVYQGWCALNPTEQYATLLETWLLRGKPEIIGEWGGGLYAVENFRKWLGFASRVPKEGIQASQSQDIDDKVRYGLGWYNLGLLYLFGLIEIQQGWRIESIQRTPFGDALLAVLHHKLHDVLEGIFALEDDETFPPGILQPVLQPYFLHWQNNLSIPKWEFREGTYTFKVSLGRMWRRIAIQANEALDALAAIILDAVGFDDDHLYRFSYQNLCGAMAHINHPYLEEGVRTDEVLVGDVPLRVGQSMIYFFDFGDNWEFIVTLEEVDPQKKVDKPFILEGEGEAPEQYSFWDDDDDDDDEWE
ncbi:MAG: plasmid pRiA4b ORF-3 family protein [Ardenticatenales bacterium]|nr:plasmid pRiA4b ORF-3 family protein [Ardenticatenales bacterium]